MEDDTRFDYARNKDEYIICCAFLVIDPTKSLIHLPVNVDCGYVVTGHRHHNCIEIMANIGKSKSIAKIQGFLTSKNRFLTRKEAKLLAIANGQAIDNGDSLLYSEELY